MHYSIFEFENLTNEDILEIANNKRLELQNKLNTSTN